MKPYIYADNAATTRLDPDAFEAMKPYLLEEYGNPSQPYFFSERPKEAISEAKEVIARCINASPDEIYFTSGGTESDNWAIKGLPLALHRRDEIITTEIEHHAVLKACCAAKELGYHITYLPVTNEGTVLPEALRSAVSDKTKLVSIMTANNEIGTVEPIKQLCEISHEKGALFHTDAVQAVGHIKIDVKELGVDLLSASAHKFGGPKGVGFLYIKKETDISPIIVGGAQQQEMRAGSENVPGIVGMAAALKKSCEEMDKTSQHLQVLEGILTSRLNKSGIDYIRNGSAEHLPGLISLSFKGADGELIFNRLDLMSIYVSTGAACNGTESKLSHVIEAIKCDPLYARGTIRISFGKSNTEDDAENIAKAICDILK